MKPWWILPVLSMAVPGIAGAQSGGADTSSAAESQSTAEKGTPIEVDTRITAGFAGVADEGSLLRASEYEPADSRPGGAINLVLKRDDIRLHLLGETRHENQIEASGDLEIGRIVQLSLGYQRMYHFLEHDSLSNLGFDSGGSLDVVDADPSAAYQVDRRELEPEIQIRIPKDMLGIQQLTLSGKYRYLRRDGHDQARTISHCGSCHVYADTRRFDQRRDEFEIGVSGSFHRRLSVSYRRIWRNLDERSDPPTFDYGEVPPLVTGLLPISGVHPFGSTPDLHSSTDRISALYKAPLGINASVIYMFRNAANDTTENETSTDLFGVRLSAKPHRWIRTRLSYRFLRVLPDVEDSISRLGHRVGGTVGYAPSSRFALEAGYEFERYARTAVVFSRIASDEHPISDGEYFMDEKTTEVEHQHTATAKLTYRPKPGLRLSARYRYLTLDNPLGTLSYQTSFSPTTGDVPQPNVDGIYPSLSRIPDRAHEVKAEVKWFIVPTWSVAPSYRLEIADGERGDRAQTDHSAGLATSYMPTSWLELNGAYHYRQNHVRTDLYYGQLGGLRSLGDGWVDIADDTVYDSESHTAIAMLGWSPIDAMWLRGSFAYTRAEALYESTGATAGIGDLSALAADIRSARFGAEWSLMDDWLAGAEYRFDQYIDYPSRLNDGRVQRVWVYLGWTKMGEVLP